MNIKKDLTPWEKLTIARAIDRPTSLDYISEIFDSFMEFHGDRNFKDDPAIVGGIANLAGRTVTVIGQQKGRNIKENVERNFGMPYPEGYRKALRLMKQAEKFNRPVICFVDTSGAYCGVGAEERGQGEAIAKNLMTMANLKTPIISIVIGEGGSGGALAMAVADKVWMLENSVYSLLSPEGFASILWKDAGKAREAAEVMKITAEDLFNYKIIDKVIDEPKGGAQNDVLSVAEVLKKALIENIDELSSNDVDALIESRYNKFRKIGEYME